MGLESKRKEEKEKEARGGEEAVIYTPVTSLLQGQGS